MKIRGQYTLNTFQGYKEIPETLGLQDQKDLEVRQGNPDQKDRKARQVLLVIKGRSGIKVHRE